jgi:hypothetical protein
VVAAFTRFPADEVFPAMLVLLGVDLRLSGRAFFKDFFKDFLGAFFAAGFFVAVFLVFFGKRLPFFARFFGVDALAVRARSDLRAFFGARFLAVVFLAVATTISSIAQTRLSG